MEHFGSQMPTFANDRDAASQPQHAAQSRPSNGNPKSTDAVQKQQHGCADVKPRLTKEQHDILEAYFQQQHKPSTNTKKGFAESLGVPVDKINNWFQNRRAKVKQDAKKQNAQFNMNMNMYGSSHLPMGSTQYSAHSEPPHPQPIASDYYSVNADISPTALPVDNVDGVSALEPLGPHMHLHQFDMHTTLRSIPETDRPTTYNPNAVMQSFMAATVGAPYMHSHQTSMPAQDPGFSFDNSGIPQSYPTDLAFSVPATIPADSEHAHDVLNGLGDFSGFDYSGLTTATASASTQGQEHTGSISSEPSPFSGAQSTATTQSSGGPNASSVTSIASVYSNWTDDHKSSADITPANQNEDPFNHPYNLPHASTSEHALPFWGNHQQTSMGQPYSQAEFCLQGNASAQAILSSPEHAESRKLSATQSELEMAASFADEDFGRRNSSTSALANGIESVNIHNGQSADGFKQPAQPSTIASRRQKRPAALNSSSLRSASYTSGMPSPGANQSQNMEHSLRRIRSSGISNAGRVQKAPGSAQRSPLNFTFAEAAASPKFARTASGFTTTVGPSGSLAPPTPLTPSEMSRFPYWQSSTVMKSHAPLPDHSSPESLNVGWPVEPQSAGLYSNGASPPSTPLDLGHLNQTRLATDNIYRDTPPQSAPATQDSFPRTAFMNPPLMNVGFRSTSDLTIMQPKPSHFRRPSLPDTSHYFAESHMQFPVQYGSVGDLQANYDYSFKDGSLHNMPKTFISSMAQDSTPYQASANMPEFFVHEYSPPQGPSVPRRQMEMQPKNYVFANQGPRDFRS